MLPRPARLCRPRRSPRPAHPRKPRLLDVGRRIPARDRFAPDSPLEGDGFEPSVPHKKQPFLAAPVRSRNSPSATKTGSFVPGTDGSNPSPSSGESAANLTFERASSAGPPEQFRVASRAVPASRRTPRVSRMARQLSPGARGFDSHPLPRSVRLTGAFHVCETPANRPSCVRRCRPHAS